MCGDRASPAWFASPQPDWPPNSHTTDFPLFDDAGAAASSDVEAFVTAGAPPIVHHGGMGTIALPLGAGTPQLAVPLFDDQPDNAARVERLGVGDVLAATKSRADSVAAKLEALLASREVADRCQTIAARMRTPDRFGKACEIIERYLPG